jgi:hypothetical protein
LNHRRGSVPYTARSRRSTSVLCWRQNGLVVAARSVETPRSISGATPPSTGGPCEPPRISRSPTLARREDRWACTRSRRRRPAARRPGTNRCTRPRHIPRPTGAPSPAYGCTPPPGARLRQAQGDYRTETISPASILSPSKDAAPNDRGALAQPSPFDGSTELAEVRLRVTIAWINGGPRLSHQQAS